MVDPQQGRARRPWLAVLLVFVAACASTKTVPTAGPPRPTTSNPFRDLLVPSDACVAPPPATISRQDALGDLQRVERILRQGYAGFDVLTRSGLDWAEVFRSARAAVEGLTEPISIEDFRRFLIRTFSVTRDGHLAFWTVAANGKWQWGSAGAHQDAFGADVALGRAADGSWTVRHSPDPSVLGSVVLDCEGDPLDELLRLTVVGDPPEPAWLLTRMSVTPPGPLSCRLQSNNGVHSKQLPLHRLRVSESKALPGMPVFERAGGEVLRLRLRNLGDSERASMEAFVATGSMARTARAVIIDVRGNPGGSDTFVRDWFKELTAGPLRYSVIEELQSDVTLQGAVNWLTCKLASKKLQADARSAVEQELSEATKDLEHAADRVRRPYRDWSVRSPMDQGQAPTPFSGSLVVLVDSSCASSCESLVMYARQIPGALIVGENTAGVGVFGEVRPYRLPSSGIWMQAGRKWFHDPNPTKVAEEGRGYLPDIWIDSEEAGAVVDGLASCLAQEGCRLRIQERVRGGESPQTSISLRALTHSGATLEGEVLNQDGPVAKEVVVEVTFRDARGNAVATQEFKVVPGGDGKLLPPRTAKRFKYHVDFGSTARGLSVSGRVSKIVPASP